jgi:hypothetical protein
MSRYAAAPAILLIIGLPIWIKPFAVIGIVAFFTGLLCLAGVLRRSLHVTLIGCVLAVMALAVALWWSASPMSVFGAVAFGIALLFLLDTVHFAHQFQGAQVERPAWHSQAAWWLVRAAASCGAAVGLTLSASAIAPLLPSFGRPIIAAAGALSAFVAVLLASTAESRDVSGG